MLEAEASGRPGEAGEVRAGIRGGRCRGDGRRRHLLRERSRRREGSGASWNGGSISRGVFLEGETTSESPTEYEVLGQLGSNTFPAGALRFMAGVSISEWNN